MDSTLYSVAGPAFLSCALTASKSGPMSVVYEMLSFSGRFSPRNQSEMTMAQLPNDYLSYAHAYGRYLPHRLPRPAQWSSTTLRQLFTFQHTAHIPANISTVCT